jgi:hypothetical protein
MLQVSGPLPVMSGQVEKNAFSSGGLSPHPSLFPMGQGVFEMAFED